MTRAVCVAILLAASSAVAQPAEPERLYNDGQKAYDEKRYDDALVLWRRSYEMSRLPALQFNIAQAYRLRAHPGDCAMAVDRYRKFIELEPRSPRRATAEAFLREMSACAVSDVAPVDHTDPGLPPVAPPVLPHEAPGGGGGMRVAGYVALGSGVVLGLTGVYFGAKAHSLSSEVTEACAHGCDWVTVADKDAQGHSAERTQWVLYGVGAGALVAGGVLYYLGSRPSPVAVAPHGDGAVVTWSGAW